MPEENKPESNLTEMGVHSLRRDCSCADPQDQTGDTAQVPTEDKIRIVMEGIGARYRCRNCAVVKGFIPRSTTSGWRILWKLERGACGAMRCARPAATIRPVFLQVSLSGGGCMAQLDSFSPRHKTDVIRVLLADSTLMGNQLLAAALKRDRRFCVVGTAQIDLYDPGNQLIHATFSRTEIEHD